MADVTVTQGDTAPPIVATLQQTIDGVQTVINLTGCTVQFVAKKAGASITGAATLSGTPTDGKVSFPFGPTDTAAPGDYLFKWVVTTGGGKVFSVPNKGTNSLSVEAF